MDDGKYEVKIIKFEGDEVVRTIPCPNERSAERVELGLYVNIKHKDYYVEIYHNGEVL